MAKSPGARPPKSGGSGGGGPKGPSLTDEVAKLAAAIEALAGASKGVPGKGAGAPGIAGAGLGPRAFSRMTDPEVLDRLKTIHGGLPKGFGAESVVRFGGKVDWRATEGLMRQSARGERDQRKVASAADLGGREVGDKFASAIMSGMSRILPTAIARPISDAFRKTREWREFADSLGDVARNARAAGIPLAANAATVARVAALGGAAGAAILGVPAAAIGGVAAAYGVGQHQMASMSAIAPFNARMLSEVVDLELSRFQRSIARADGVAGTGAGLIKSRDFLEHSLLRGQVALDNIGNRIGIGAFGGLGITAGMAFDAMGLGKGGMRAGAVDTFLIEMVRSMGNVPVPGGHVGVAQGANPHVRALALAGPGAPGGGAWAMVRPDPNAPPANRDALNKLNANLDWIQQTAPEMAAALVIPSLLSGIAGALGAFGAFGQPGFAQGVQKAVDDAAKQLQQFEAQRGQNHQSWMKAFGAIAEEGIIADRDARGTTWELGPQGMGNAVVMGDLAPFGRRRDPRRRRRRRRDDD